MISDLQGDKRTGLRIEYRHLPLRDGDAEWQLTVSEPGPDGQSGTTFFPAGTEARSRDELLVDIASWLADRFFPEAGATAALLDGEAWWVRPAAGGRRMARIGAPP